ncbi:uncharacterized protein METZ01_LOCUS439361, partial [marine metagenome]
MKLYIAAVNESMNEASYPAKLAGMNYSVSNDAEGISIIVSGYSDSIDDLLLEIINNMNSIDIPDEQFDAMKDQMIREWKNIDLGDAYRIARENMRKIVRKYYYTNIELSDAAKNLTLQDVKNFSLLLMKKGYIEAMVFGNVTESQAKENTDLLINKLRIRAVKKEKVSKQGRIIFSPGEEIISMIKSQVNNSCLWR